MRNLFRPKRRDTPLGWVRFKSPKLGYEIDYPATWKFEPQYSDTPPKDTFVLSAPTIDKYETRVSIWSAAIKDIDSLYTYERYIKFGYMDEADGQFQPSIEPVIEKSPNGFEVILTLLKFSDWKRNIYVSTLCCAFIDGNIGWQIRLTSPQTPIPDQDPPKEPIPDYLISDFVKVVALFKRVR